MTYLIASIAFCAGFMLCAIIVAGKDQPGKRYLELMNENEALRQSLAKAHRNDYRGANGRFAKRPV
jgi:hypothetical protein